SLVHIAKIPTIWNKDIKLIRETLLTNADIKKEYSQFITKNSNIEKILDIYAKKSNFDLKIYATSAYDNPNNYIVNPINFKIKSKHGDLDITQYPALSQQITLEDPTNYCGYYAIYNASLLGQLGFS